MTTGLAAALSNQSSSSPLPFGNGAPRSEEGLRPIDLILPRLTHLSPICISG